MDKPKLSLVPKPKELKASNFWSCCPLRCQYLPERPCPEGEPQKQDEDSRCSWWINSESHNFCFWRYVKDKSDADGVMKELVQSELAALFGWSNTKTHFMLKQAVAELTEALKIHGAAELLSELNSSDEFENSVTVDDLSEPKSDESIE